MIEELMEKAYSCFSKTSTTESREGYNNSGKNFKNNNKIGSINVLPRLLNSFQLPYTHNNDITNKNNNKINDFTYSTPEILLPTSLPSDGDLDQAFENLLKEFDLSNEQNEHLRRQPKEKKWLMIVEQTIRQGQLSRQESCEYYIDLLSRYILLYPDGNDASEASQQIEELAICLRTGSTSYLENFISLGGLEKLTKLVELSLKKSSRYKTVLPILQCLRALMNSSVGREAVLYNNSKTLYYIAGAISFPNARCKLLALSLLSGVCLLSEEGHSGVLKAFTKAIKIFGERSRFQRLLDELNREQEEKKDTEKVRIAVMGLLNALLKSGISENSLQFRLQLRYEMLMLGLQEVIDKLKNSNNQTLEDHFELFEMMREEDELEFASSLSITSTNSSFDYESPNIIVDTILRKLDNSIALPYFISILQHLLMLPGDVKNIPIWKLFNLILQQLIFQVNSDEFNYSAYIDDAYKINVNQLMEKLKTQIEYDQLQRKFEEVQRDLLNEKEKVIELENRLADIQDGSSLDCFSRISETSSNPSDPCHSPTPTITSNASNSLSYINKNAPLPPPLPSAFGKVKLKHIKYKNVPKSDNSLKSINWSVIPQEKIPGTIWENLGDEKMYEQLDLPSISLNFSSQKHDDISSDNGTMNTLTRRLKNDNLISVIDSRRAQNCNIMLSKLKMTNKEIKNALLNMNEKNKIPKDMIEQMLKFVPTIDEVDHLNEVLQKYKTPTILAPADRFLYEVSTIIRYEQRLKCINIIRTFSEKAEELLKSMESVSKASNALSSNLRLKTLLALILSIGNYLNQGKHNGNAFGFHSRSLSSVTDVKYSYKNDKNLLHYIVEMVEEKYPNVVSLNKDLAVVYDASRVNEAEVRNEFKILESSLHFLIIELKIQKQLIEENKECNVGLPDIIEEIDENGISKSTIPSAKNFKEMDKFVNVVTSFLSTSKVTLRNLQRNYTKFQESLNNCLKYFGEDNKMITGESFFSNFSKFLNSFEECRNTLVAEKEENERIKRNTLIKKQFPKKIGKQNKNHFKKNQEKDFEKLLNAIQSGEIFHDELNRLRASFRESKRSRKIISIS
ncbi:Delphilin [Strongyloides ratti]|uniref:Delphilin n=1 Tax=Strongyloides ratti TaxID=34506 RepID=A0A090LKV3_STRRB|nr:Delphilin [Strongyloides ratti]CEF68788.1 Delphilin [Strongyloides ratti]